MTEAEASPRRRKYRDPPVAEAITRLQWYEPAIWNLTTPGRLFERLMNLYPEEPRSQNVLQASLEQGSPGGPAAGLQVIAGAQKMVYSAESGSRLVMMSPTDISAHGLQPYEGWEALEPRVFEAVDRVTPTLYESPPTVKVVGLRYINRIEIPSTNFSFADYLTITIGFPPGFPPQIGSFMDRTEMSYPDEPVRLALTWASVEAPPGSSAFVIDLDYYFEPDEPVTLDDARTALNDLKAREGLAFEALLQNRLREQFGELE